jgi:hypothetical protein
LGLVTRPECNSSEGWGRLPGNDDGQIVAMATSLVPGGSERTILGWSFFAGRSYRRAPHHQWVVRSAAGRWLCPVLVLEDTKRVRVGLLREFVRGERHAKLVIGRATFCSDGFQGLEIESVQFCGI